MSKLLDAITALIPVFQFLTGSRFHFYGGRPGARIGRPQVKFQFLTGSRFHFYAQGNLGCHCRRHECFNSLQEVGFISTTLTSSAASIPPTCFNSLQEVGFISTQPAYRPGHSPNSSFQFLAGSRFHFYQYEERKRQREEQLFQFLAGSRFHFYTWTGLGPGLDLDCFNSLQEVGFISTKNGGCCRLAKRLIVSIPCRK